METPKPNPRPLPASRSSKSLTIKLGKPTDVSQLRGDRNCLAHFHVGLSGRAASLSPGSVSFLPLHSTWGT